MLVFIGKLSLSTLRWVPICQGFRYFHVFFHDFVLAKLATSSIRVNTTAQAMKDTTPLPIDNLFNSVSVCRRHFLGNNTPSARHCAVSETGGRWVTKALWSTCLNNNSHTVFSCQTKCAPSGRWVGLHTARGEAVRYHNRYRRNDTVFYRYCYRYLVKILELR